jgi:hypothetical protein
MGRPADIAGGGAIVGAEAPCDRAAVARERHATKKPPKQALPGQLLRLLIQGLVSISD